MMIAKRNYGNPILINIDKIICIEFCNGTADVHLVDEHEILGVLEFQPMPGSRELYVPFHLNKYIEQSKEVHNG